MGFLRGHRSTCALRELLLYWTSDTSLSFPVLISYRPVTGGAAPRPGRSLYFCPLKYLDGDMCQDNCPGEIRAQSDPLWDGRESFTWVEKSSWSVLLWSPVVANQSNFASVSPFDAQHLKLPSKVLSTLRGFFHNTLNSTILLSHQGNWEGIQVPARGKSPKTKQELSPQHKCSWHKPFVSLQQFCEEGEALPHPPIYRWGNLGSMNLKNLGAVKGTTKWQMQNHNDQD